MKWMLAAAAAVLVHFLASVALVFELVGNACAFAASIPGGGEVSSKDELVTLGLSPGFGILSIAGVGILGFVVTLALLGAPTTRRSTASRSASSSWSSRRPHSNRPCRTSAVESLRRLSR